MNTEIINFIAVCLSFIGVLFVLLALPGVISQLLLKNVKEQQSSSFKSSIERTQRFMALGVIVLMVGKLGTTISNNSLNSSQIIYGVIITLLAIIYISVLSFKKVLSSKTLKQSVNSIKEKAHLEFDYYRDAKILVIGLNVILIHQFVLV